MTGTAFSWSLEAEHVAAVVAEIVGPSEHRTPVEETVGATEHLARTRVSKSITMAADHRAVVSAERQGVSERLAAVARQVASAWPVRFEIVRPRTVVGLGTPFGYPDIQVAPFDASPDETASFQEAARDGDVVLLRPSTRA